MAAGQGSGPSESRCGRRLLAQPDLVANGAGPESGGDERARSGHAEVGDRRRDTAQPGDQIRPCRRHAGPHSTHAQGVRGRLSVSGVGPSLAPAWEGPESAGAAGQTTGAGRGRDRVPMRAPGHQMQKDDFGPDAAHVMGNWHAHGIAEWHRSGEDAVATIVGPTWPDGAQDRLGWVRNGQAFVSKCIQKERPRRRSRARLR